MFFHRRRRRVYAATFLALLAASTARGQSANDATFRTLAGLFAYDAALPLNARTFEKFDTTTFTRQKLVFDGWRGSRVPGLIAVPKNAAARHAGTPTGTLGVPSGPTGSSRGPRQGRASPPVRSRPTRRSRRRWPAMLARA